jgi:16S rRNA C967 or C1407 C5-methylase (RsmB/RsmF family)/NOL1/NOP2/fmu family ribosome biogenesis protein
MKSSDHMSQPPPEFLKRMHQLLPGDEFHAFAAALDRSPHVGLRVNTLKISVADFIRIVPFSLAPAGRWEPAAFIVKDDSRPGRHPYHDAGLYYLQEPSAIVAASLLAPEAGELVLDLAAAPGGKATHLAALMQAKEGDEDGLLVANDVHAGRSRLLAENLARWGATETLITQDEPDRMAAAFGPVFDRVLIDAPCSGEGMFRRRDAVEWSEAIVQACARRQHHILATAPRLVRPGGRLLYATCTFAPEENEQVIAAFLAANRDFYVEELPEYDGFDRGRPQWADAPSDFAGQLVNTVRLWPHRFSGEGHFIALLRRSEHSQVREHLTGKLIVTPPTNNQLVLWERFASEALTIELASDRFHIHQNQLYLLPRRTLPVPRLHIRRYGSLLGEVRSGYFRPAHDLALMLRENNASNALNLTAEDPLIRRYLAGEDTPSAGPDGWVMVCVAGYGLGWGKRVKGRLKNHYPRQLRRPPSSP